jgi:phospholipase C
MKQKKSLDRERKESSMLKHFVRSAFPILIAFLLLVSMGMTIFTMHGVRVNGQSTQQSFQRHDTITPIKHIVYIIKENRTFDSYFGAFPGVNGATTGQARIHGQVQTIPLNPLTDSVLDYCHNWPCAHIAYDTGHMDNFNGNVKCNAPPYPCYRQADAKLIPNYWALAKNFVLNDNTFSSLEGASFPNHLFTVAAGSGPDQAHSAILNPFLHGRPAKSWGCDADKKTTTQLLNGQNVYPCFTYTTLADELEAAGISWKFYAPQSNEPGCIWNTLDGFSSIRDTNLWSQRVVPWQNLTADARNNTLPAFSWVTAPIVDSEHPPASSCAGENWTVTMINAIEQSPAWSSTAIFLTWDDWGGFYDHVTPAVIDGLGYGFRVPFMMISPYAYATTNAGNNPHVDHTTLEFSSVLRFAEQNFNLPSLQRRDTSAGDLMKDFDFSQVHNPPLILQLRTCPSKTLPLVGDFND